MQFIVGMSDEVTSYKITPNKGHKEIKPISKGHNWRLLTSKERTAYKLPHPNMPD